MELWRLQALKCKRSSAVIGRTEAISLVPKELHEYLQARLSRGLARRD